MNLIWMKKTAYVIEFNGDIKASQNHGLRESISAVLSIAKPEDEVVIKSKVVGHGTLLWFSLSSVRQD